MIEEILPQRTQRAQSRGPISVISVNSVANIFYEL
jgi:hypothetical protein